MAVPRGYFITMMRLLFIYSSDGHARAKKKSLQASWVWPRERGWESSVFPVLKMLISMLYSITGCYWKWKQHFFLLNKKMKETGIRCAKVSGFTEASRYLFWAVKVSLWGWRPLYTTRIRSCWQRAPSVSAIDPRLDGWSYKRTNCLWTCMVIHYVSNRWSNFVICKTVFTKFNNAHTKCPPLQITQQNPEVLIYHKYLVIVGDR